MNPGDRFGMLTFVERAENYVSPGGQSHAQGLFRCDCGEFRKVRYQMARTLRTRSCGCTHYWRGDDLACPVGETFGHLKILREVEPVFHKAGKGRPSKKTRRVECRCYCGSLVIRHLHNIRQGAVMSCGCARIDHGYSNTRTYRIWAGMIQRSTGGGGSDTRRNYFERGIRVCKRWRNFPNFLHDMGEAPEGLTLDRKNNNRGYSLENCRWATQSQQLRNTRRTTFVVYKGERTSMQDLADKLGRDSKLVANRLRRGWSIDKAVETPTGKYVRS